MNRKIILIIYLMISISITPIFSYAESNAIYSTNSFVEYKKEEQKVLDNYPEIGCKAVYIAEPTTGKIIYEKNAHEKMFPASTTKLLTALVTMEKCKLSEKAIVSQNAISLVPEGYTNAKLVAGEELDIETLLYALLLPSANEVANVLAEHISGSIDAFVDLCNSRAKELGCETLHFVNTNGIHDENHYCSAYDLYLIAKECRKHDIFNKIVKTTSFTIPTTNVYPRADRTFKNSNEMLLIDNQYYYENCTGIKTGFTTPAGECFVGSSYYNGMELISVVLGGKEKNSNGLNERFYDTKKLFEFAYDNYSRKNIAEFGDSTVSLKVGKATKDTAELDLIVDTTISAIVPNDINKENVSYVVSIEDGIVAPIERNQVLGTVTYNADGLVYKTNLVASHEVEKLPYGLYNAVVASVLVLSLVLIIVVLKKSKKKWVAIVFAIIVLAAEGLIIAKAYKEGEEGAVTRSSFELGSIQDHWKSHKFI